MKFYICAHSGNTVTFLRESGVPVICCGERMKELVPGRVDASLEKHVPVVEIKGDRATVKVGAVEHPMIPEHFIEWIVLETGSGFQNKTLNPGEAPHAVFSLAPGEKPVAAYAFCNLHGLWKKEI